MHEKWRMTKGKTVFFKKKEISSRSRVPELIKPGIIFTKNLFTMEIAQIENLRCPGKV